jgi:hypothetical protein
MLERTPETQNELPIQEKSNLAEWLESRLHMSLTQLADDMFGGGNVTRDERKILSGAIGVALDAYHQFLTENAAQLFTRSPWGEAPASGAASPVNESGAVLQEPYPNEHAARMKNPDDFEADSFRNKTLPGKAGVRIVMGKLKGETAMTTQAYRFAADSFTPEQAKKWLKDNDVKTIGFEPAVKAKESDGGIPSYNELVLTESGEGMIMPLLEKAVRRDGTIPIRIIKPGWGSSGYYPAEVLERDGPKVFTQGLKMYWDHPTLAEASERPEGSLNNLAAELVSDAKYHANDVAGAGLYADAKVFEAYKPAIDDLAAHIGVSIRAAGKGDDGSREGRQGLIISELTAAKSVDFVTQAGAGGQILSLFEAARTTTAVQNIPTTSGDVEIQSQKEKRMDELQKMQEANATLQTQLDEMVAENARQKGVMTLQEAAKLVSQALSKFELPEVTKARLLENLPKAATLKDGKLDETVFQVKIAEAVKAEVEYLTKAAGLGKITGLGDSGANEEGAEAKTQKSLEESFQRIGLDEKAAKIAAQGRD